MSSTPRPELRVGFIDSKAARYAVEKWHYSKRLPVGKLVRLGVWEGDRFIGAVVFSWGANHNLSSQFGLKMTECAELVRVALRAHEAPVTRIVAEAIRILKQHSPGLRVVVSFADPDQGHVGRIYQAGNWVYLGATPPKKDLMDRDGVTLNRRAYTGQTFGKERQAIPRGAKWIRVSGKHRYAMPLDKAMRRLLLRRALPYPQPADEVSTGDTSVPPR